MKKILFIITLCLPLFIKAQVVPAVRDTVRPSNIGAAYTPTFSDAMQNGILTHYVRRGTSNVYDFMPSSKYLRANYGQLAGGNTWYDFQNFLGAIAYSYATNTSYAGTLVAGDNASGQYKIGNINNSGFGGLTTFANSVAEWRIGRIPGGAFGSQRWNGSTWVNAIVTSADGTSTTINGSPVLTNANSYSKTQQDSIYQRLVNRYDTQSNIAGDKTYTGMGVYSTDGGVTGTTINNMGVTTNGVNGFLFSNSSITSQMNGNAIYTINKNTGYQTSLRPERISFNIGDNQLSLNAIPTTNNRSQTFQDKNGTIALLSDITGSSGATYSKSYIDSADATKESLSNKTNTLTNSTTQYPTTQAVTNALAGYTLNTRAINTGVGLLGGGNLSADRTLTADTTTLATKAYGNNQWVTRSTAQTINGLKTFGSSILPLTNATYSLGNATGTWLSVFTRAVQSDGALTLNTINNNGMVFQMGGVEKARFSPANGFLLLGTPTDNMTDRLQVVGSANISTLLRFNAVTPTGNQIYGVNAAGTVGEAKTLTASSATGQLISNAANSITLSNDTTVLATRGYVNGLQRTRAFLNSNINLALNADYLATTSTLYTGTPPPTTGFLTDGSKLITVSATGSAGARISCPSGYTLQGLSGTATPGTGGITIVNGGKVQLAPIGTNAYQYYALSGSVSVN